MSKQTFIMAMADQVGAVSFTPPPLRAVRGVSMTYEQLERFFDLAQQMGMGRMVRLTKDQIEFGLNCNMEDPSEDESDGFYCGVYFAERHHGVTAESPHGFLPEGSKQ